MANKEDQHKVFMDIAYKFASLSHCTSIKVGAIAVKDDRIIASGINGTAPQYFNCDEVFSGPTFDREKHHQFSEKYEIHAEMNIILFAAKNGISLNNCTLYCTLHPCWNCIKHLSVVGIHDIYYDKMYDKIETNIDNIKEYCKITGIRIRQFNSI